MWISSTMNWNNLSYSNSLLLHGYLSSDHGQLLALYRVSVTSSWILLCHIYLSDWHKSSEQMGKWWHFTKFNSLFVLNSLFVSLGNAQWSRFNPTSTCVLNVASFDYSTEISNLICVWCNQEFYVLISWADLESWILMIISE